MQVTIRHYCPGLISLRIFFQDALAFRDVSRMKCFICPAGKKYGSVEIPSSFLSWRGICEGDPLSPPVGEAAQGGRPP